MTNHDERHWNPVSRFPSPSIRLLVRLNNGEEVEAIRPEYVRSYSADPNYRRLDNDELLKGVVEWRYL